MLSKVAQKTQKTRISLTKHIDKVNIYQQAV